MDPFPDKQAKIPAFNLRGKTSHESEAEVVPSPFKSPRMFRSVPENFLCAALAFSRPASAMETSPDRETAAMENPHEKTSETVDPRTSSGRRCVTLLPHAEESKLCHSKTRTTFPRETQGVPCQHWKIRRSTPASRPDIVRLKQGLAFSWASRRLSGRVVERLLGRRRFCRQAGRWYYRLSHLALELKVYYPCCNSEVPFWRLRSEKVPPQRARFASGSR